MEIEQFHEGEVQQQLLAPIAVAQDHISRNPKFCVGSLTPHAACMASLDHLVDHYMKQDVGLDGALI